MPVRAVRGATQVDIDESAHLLDRVVELVSTVLTRNGLADEDFASVLEAVEGLAGVRL